MKLNFEIKSNGLLCDLAKWCAETIHAAVVRQHLLALHNAGLVDHAAYNRAVINDAFRDAQAVIRSIPDNYDRISFVGLVKLYFRQARERNSTCVRTRDYVQSVRQHQLKEAA